MTVSIQNAEVSSTGSKGERSFPFGLGIGHGLADFSPAMFTGSVPPLRARCFSGGP